MKACFYHHFKRKKSPIMTGWGDCLVCLPDEKNKQCRGYIEINLSEYVAEDIPYANQKQETNSQRAENRTQY